MGRITLVGNHLHQWDTNRYVTIPSEYAGSRVYMWTGNNARNAPEIETTTVDGVRVACIPNQFLTEKGKVYVAVYGTDYQQKEVFYVSYAPKPENYVLEPTRLVTYASIDAIMAEMQRIVNSESTTMAQISQSARNASDAQASALVSANNAAASLGEVQRIKAQIDASAHEVPTKLPNPKALTINGEVYDGSAPVEVTIASGEVYDDTAIKGRVRDLENRASGWDAKSTFGGSYAELTGKPTLFDGDYNSLSNRPQLRERYPNPLPVHINGVQYDGSSEVWVNVEGGGSSYDDTELRGRIETIEGKESGWDGKSDFSGNYNDLTNKPAIPAAYDDTALAGRVSTIEGKESGWNSKADGNHTHTELHTHANKSVLDGITSDKVSAWDGKSDFSGSYNDLTNKPTIPSVLNVSFTIDEEDGSATCDTDFMVIYNALENGYVVNVTDSNSYKYFETSHETYEDSDNNEIVYHYIGFVSNDGRNSQTLYAEVEDVTDVSWSYESINIGQEIYDYVDRNIGSLTTLLGGGF